MSIFLKSILFLILVSFIGEAKSQVQKISYRGYADCYQISNDSVKLIVVAQAGARILNYSLNAKNSIYEDATLNGKTIVDFNSKTFEPDGGRFDIRGITTIGKQHDTLWIGPYTTEITGKYSMKMTSMIDKNLGIDVCREFILDSTSSHLRIRQTMTNRSNKETNWYFWGRIFSPIDGKIVIPLNPNSKYGSKWGYYNGNIFVSSNAKDTLVEALDTILSFRAVKTGVKMRYAADINRGWILYGQNELLLLMKYNVDLSKTYLTDSGESLIYYTDGVSKVELEPVSPAVKLTFGQSYTFEENWWLFSYPKAKTKDFDGTQAASYALSKAVFTNNKPVNNSEIMRSYHSIGRSDIAILSSQENGVAKIIGKGVTSAQICSMCGKVVNKQKFSGYEEINLLNIESIHNGIYFAKIFYNNDIAFVTRKVLINRTR